MQIQRSLLLFQESIKSPHTRNLYLHHLNKFIGYSNIKDYDELVSISESKIQIMLEDYLIHLKKTLSPNTIPIAMAPLELFFTLNDKTCNFKKLRKMFPAHVKKSGSKPWTTQDVQKMLRGTTKTRTRALILFLASTGCRIGVVEELRLRNMVEMPEKCKAIQFYDGSNEEYWGFLTPEASATLEEYLEERRRNGETLSPNSLLFRDESSLDSSNPLSKKVAQMALFYCIKNSGIKRERLGKRYDIQLAHGFRKRFNTILKLNHEVNYNIAEKLMGHKNGLDGVYLTPTKEQSFAEFRKAISDLTVDDSERLSIENQKLEVKLTAHEKLGTENTILVKTTEEMKKQLLDLENKNRENERLVRMLMKSNRLENST